MRPPSTGSALAGLLGAAPRGPLLGLLRGPVLGRVLAAALGATALGCGAAPTRPDVDEAFHRIQVHEATIAHRSGDAARCAPDATCPAAAEVCEAAEALCAIATELDDPDALTRCEHARRRCDEPPETRA